MGRCGREPTLLGELNGERAPEYVEDPDGFREVFPDMRYNMNYMLQETY
jgi:hypothetical protein